MKRKDAAVQAQVGSLQMKIVAEDKVVEQKTTELLQEWEKGKPVQVLISVDLCVYMQCFVLPLLNTYMVTFGLMMQLAC